MRTKVFAHKHFIGIESSFEAEGLLNDPSQQNQLGFVVDADFCDIQPEALELLKKIPKSQDDIGDVDVFKAEDGKVIFSWLGGNLVGLETTNTTVSGSHLYDPELLVANPTVKTSPEFIQAVEEFLEEYPEP